MSVPGWHWVPMWCVRRFQCGFWCWFWRGFWFRFRCGFRDGWVEAWYSRCSLLLGMPPGFIISLQVVISFAKLGLSENRAAQNLMELIITFPYFGHQSGHIFGLNSHFRKNPTGPPNFLNSPLSPRSSTASVPSYYASWRVSGRNVARAMPRSWGMGDGPGQKLEKRALSLWDPWFSVRFSGNPSNVTFYLFKGLVLSIHWPSLISLFDVSRRPKTRIFLNIHSYRAPQHPMVHHHFSYKITGISRYTVISCYIYIISCFQSHPIAVEYQQYWWFPDASSEWWSCSAKGMWSRAGVAS